MGKNGFNITLQTSDAALVHVDTGDDLEVTGVWSHWGGAQVLLARAIAPGGLSALVAKRD